MPECEQQEQLKEINASNLWDWRLDRFEGDKLHILGSRDFYYYHNLEIVFHDVDFLSCPTTFFHAQFRCATDEERAQFSGHRDWEGTMFCISTDHGQDEPSPKFYVCAGRVECVVGTVFYYERENLQPGERMAEWVKPLTGTR